MKKTKIIIPALGMLLLSTAASVTGTVAWFSMNNFVNATDMNIKAKAENGIVISNEDKTVWNDSAEAKHQQAVAVRPTSTYDATTWVHSTSSDANDENTGNPYSVITPVLDTASGVGYINDNDVADYQATDTGTAPDIVPADSAYYLVNSFYIKSSAEALTKTIYVTNVEADNGGASAQSAALDKALRVLIKSGSTTLIYAPFAGATLTYDVCKAVANDTPTFEEDVTAINPNAANNEGKDVPFLTNASIPAFSSNAPIQIDVYLYFEGEDENCKSANLVTTLDSIEVSVRFGTALEYQHS